MGTPVVTGGLLCTRDAVHVDYLGRGRNTTDTDCRYSLASFLQSPYNYATSTSCLHAGVLQFDVAFAITKELFYFLKSTNAIALCFSGQSIGYIFQSGVQGFFFFTCKGPVVNIIGFEGCSSVPGEQATGRRWPHL